MHRRVGTYMVAGAPVLVDAIDEGRPQPSASHLPDVGGSASPLRVHDALARWEGWSLAVTSPRGDGHRRRRGARVVSAPLPGGVPLTVTFDAEPGSLPRLRYGRQYQVRARAVDIAGNSLSVEAADELLQIWAAVIRRAAGAPRRGADPSSTGDSNRWAPGWWSSSSGRPRASRSNGWSSAATATRTRPQCGRRLSALPRTDPASAGLRYLATSERHLAPPKAAQLDVERRACSTPSLTTPRMPCRARRKGRLTDSASSTSPPAVAVPIPDTVDVDPVTGASAAARRSSRSRTGGSSSPASRAQLCCRTCPTRSAPGRRCAGCPASRSAPRPASTARTASYRRPVDPRSGQSWRPSVSTAAIGFDGAWPLAQTVPVRSPKARARRGGTPRPGADRVRCRQDAGHHAAQFVPAARCARTPRHLVVGGGEPSAARPRADCGDAELALRGLAWLLTPYRELTLVHAVQRPLIDRTLTRLTAVRAAGETATALVVTSRGRAQHARLDLLAGGPSRSTTRTSSLRSQSHRARPRLDTCVPPAPDWDGSVDGSCCISARSNSPAPEPVPHPAPPVPHPPAWPEAAAGNP